MKKCKKCNIKQHCKDYREYLLLQCKKEKTINRIKEKQKQIKLCVGV